MRARWAVPAALAVVFACAPARAELRARTRDLGAVSPVADYAQWTTATTMTGSTCNARASDLLTWKGAAITFSRSDSTLCCPESDASCCWAGVNEPCIHAPTYAGWASGGTAAGGIEVYGTTSNLALNSASLEAATWLKTAGAVVANASASCPRAPDGSAAMHLITAAGTGDGVYNSLVGGNGVAQTFSAWVALATGDSACPITMLDSWGGAATVTQTLSATPRRISVGQTGARDEFGVFFLRGSGGCARWCVWGPQVTKTATVQPYRSTTGTAYSGLASTATTLTVPVPAQMTDTRGAVYAQWISANTATNSRLLGFSGSATPAAVLSATSLQSWDGSNLISLSGAWSASTASWFRGEWSGSTKALTTATASSSGAYDGAWLGSVVYVGSSGGTGDFLNGLVSRVALCNRGGSACR